MLLRITALAVVASAAAAPSPALRVAALAAITTAAAPPFLTSKELRPAARRTQDFAECPRLSQSVFGPSGPRQCLPSVRGHQLHLQGGVFFFAFPFFLPPRADIVIYTDF